MMNRRTLLLGAAPRPARRQPQPSARPDWPQQVVRIVVPFAPGSFTDVSARLLASELTEQLGQSVIVENRGGAGGTAGTTMVVRAAPDGYTLLLTDTSLSISPGLYPNLPYDPVKDLAQISRIADSPSILLVRPGLGPTHARGAGGAREAEAGRDHLRLRRAGIVRASGDGIAAERHRHQGAACAVPRRRGRDRRSHRRPRRHGDREPRLGRRACAGRHAARPRRVGRASAARCCRRCRPSSRPGQPRYDMSYWWGIAAPASTPRADHRAAAPRDRPRLRQAAAARSVPASRPPSPSPRRRRR